MVTITIIVGLLVAFLVGFFCATKSIQIGLRWQIQTANKQEPVVTNPISNVVDFVSKDKSVEANKYSKEQMQEWLFGKAGE